MCRSIIKIAQVAALVAGGLSAVNAMAADGQIRINGEVINKTCAVAINGAPTSTLLQIDPIAAVDMTDSVSSANGTSMKASRDMRTVNITLEGCMMPAGKTGVAVSFDSTGYADSGTSTYRNVLLDSVNTMDTAAKGVQIGFTKDADLTKKLAMDLNTIDPADYKSTTANAQTYSFNTRYVQTGTDVVAGDIETVATFSVVYQ
ncbi:fimbrial protein [Citrobacter braakii]|uniref:fimbrial protein n=1 Tax=Citrobacter braakii TaxID=57706 RepID=UPI0034E59FD6